MNNYSGSANNKYELTPIQSRFVFDHNGWHNIVGFHTRNVPHVGHEYIQINALMNINSDAILIYSFICEMKIVDFLSYTLLIFYEPKNYNI